MNNAKPRIAISCGEPAGIGPDIIVALAQSDIAREVLVFADPDLLTQRAEALGVPLTCVDINEQGSRGVLSVQSIALNMPCVAGKLEAGNAPYVLECLSQATQACLDNTCAALVTAPVSKALLNQAGTEFLGHTQWLAKFCKIPQTQMMFVNPDNKVALHTTHIPLAEVCQHINTRELDDSLALLIQGMQQHFHIQNPRIAICGVNPHAGEDGYLGTEEEEVIKPWVKAKQQQGLNICGPFPADTILVPEHSRNFDAILAMYHDQALPAIKALHFADSVNLTLGLPIVRTSVDHGTALDLAGTGQAKPDSLFAAIQLAKQISSGVA